jgi:hypothetical protein
MVMAFKSVLAYQAAHPTGATKLLLTKKAAVDRFRRHNTNSRFWH